MRSNKSAVRIVCALFLVFTQLPLPIIAKAQGTTLTTNVPTSHSLSIEISGKGTISVDGKQYSKTTTIQIERLSNPAISVNAAKRYQVKSILFNGEDITKQFSAGDWTMPDMIADAVLTVTFEKQSGAHTEHSFGTKASNKMATDADCENAATYYVQCDNCDEVSSTKTVVVGDPKGHSFEEGKCSICGAEDPDFIPESSVTRIFGENRFYTALKIADEMKEELGISKFNTIIIASGSSFPDALTGSYLANAKQAPILLAYKHDQNVLTTDYIKANLAAGGKVYILGGTAAVPSEVEELLADYNIVRLGGKDRFETNLMILREVGVSAGQEIMVCTATNFPDSLSASATGNPILLVWNEKKALRDTQKEYLKSLSGNSFRIIGGNSAVCAELETQVSAYGTTARLAGGNRFETSVKIAEVYFDDADEVILAYAKNFPDALCGGPQAHVKGAPLILSMNQFAEDATGFINGKIHKGSVLGGTGLISDDCVRVAFGMESDEAVPTK